MRHRHLNERHTEVAGEPALPTNRLLRGKLATDADDTYVVYVILDKFDPTIQRGPVDCCRPIVVPHGTGGAEAPIYAQRGDTCWVQQDEQFNWVMVNWRPA